MAAASPIRYVCPLSAAPGASSRRCGSAYGHGSGCEVERHGRRTIIGEAGAAKAEAACRNKAQVSDAATIAKAYAICGQPLAAGMAAKLVMRARSNASARFAGAGFCSGYAHSYLFLHCNLSKRPKRPIARGFQESTAGRGSCQSPDIGTSTPCPLTNGCTGPQIRRAGKRSSFPRDLGAIC